MTDAEARAKFDKMIAELLVEGDMDRAAAMEVCREYFCNAEFRGKLEKYVYQVSVK